MTVAKTGHLKVGYDISKIMGVPDGIARYSELLLGGLLAHDDDSQFTLCDLAADAVNEARVDDLFGPHRARINIVSNWATDGLDVDLFHSPAPALPPPECHPLVFTLHDVTFISHPECHTLDNRVSAVTSAALAACRSARIIAVSHHTKAQAVEHLGLPDEQIEVIHSAPDPHFHRTERADLRQAVTTRLGIDRPYVLAVGSLEPRKNLIGLVDGMRHLPADQRDRLSLVVAGPPGWRNEEIHDHLRRAAEELSICQGHCLRCVRQDHGT